MMRFTCCFFLLATSFVLRLNSQETILKTGFAVRDFDIKENVLVYIEKRDIKSYNLKTKKPDSLFIDNTFFIGGYGLRIFYNKQQNQIITASNELIRDISSIRYYDIKTKEVNKYHVYYTSGLMDFFISPQDSMFFLSKKNLKIDVFKYGGSPRYIKADSIKLDAFARKMQKYNENLYYITDSGKLFQYNLNNKTNKMIYQSKSLLVNFIFDENQNNFFITTFEGKLIKVDLNKGKSNKEISIGKDIVEAIDIFNNKYIVTGDWTGKLKIFDIKTLKLIEELDNKKRIIKIISRDNAIYTSSVDRTIKKWIIN